MYENCTAINQDYVFIYASAPLFINNLKEKPVIVMMIEILSVAKFNETEF